MAESVDVAEAAYLSRRARYSRAAARSSWQLAESLSSCRVLISPAAAALTAAGRTAAAAGVASAGGSRPSVASAATSSP